MGKFYCNNCGEDVVLEKGKCPKCKTNWNKIIKESISSESNGMSVEKLINDDVQYDDIKQNEVTSNDIDYNINFFLTWGPIIKCLFIVVAILSVILAFSLYEKTDGASLVLILFSAGFAVYGLIAENNFKWKAYMLHSIKRKK